MILRLGRDRTGGCVSSLVTVTVLEESQVQSLSTMNIIVLIWSKLSFF